MTTRFYRTQDGVLARIRNSGAAVPEVWGPVSKRWKSYPELDTLHDAREISRSDAQELAGAGVVLDGDAPAPVRA